MKTARICAAVAALSLATWQISSAAAADALPTEDRIPATGGEIVVHPILHGTLALTWNGKTVYVDPAPGPGAAKGSDGADAFKKLPPPDVIVVTHIHGDHYNAQALEKLAGPKTVIFTPANVAAEAPAAVKAKIRIIANGESMEAAGLTIEAVPAYNVTPDKMQFHPKGVGNGYIITLGGKRVYVAGDTEATPEMRALKNIDAAFLPMNLPYTMTPEVAADAALAFKPKLIYPYHYGQSDIGIFVRAISGDKAITPRLLKWY